MTTSVWTFDLPIADELDPDTGYGAHALDRPLSANPYTLHSAEWRAWNDQWIRAETYRRQDEGTFDHTPDEYAAVRARDDDMRGPDPVREILGDDYLAEHSPGYVGPPKQQPGPRPSARKHVVFTFRVSQELLDEMAAQARSVAAAFDRLARAAAVTLEDLAERAAEFDQLAADSTPARQRWGGQPKQYDAVRPWSYRPRREAPYPGRR